MHFSSSSRVWKKKKCEIVLYFVQMLYLFIEVDQAYLKLSICKNEILLNVPMKALTALA